MDNSDKITLHCRPITAGVRQLKKQPHVHASVYEEGELEHPCLPGTMLTLDQRLFSMSLEFSDPDGVIRTETSEEKRFRIFWKKPMPLVPLNIDYATTPRSKRVAAIDTEGDTIKCLKCQKPMVVRNGARGAFHGCTGYPECKGTRPI